MLTRSPDEGCRPRLHGWERVKYASCLPVVSGREGYLNFVVKCGKLFECYPIPFYERTSNICQLTP